jgi:bifunctional DNA-binding transcriptional regulator/antitoxin component of YhaV-PrlF toxin-antitoxin module
MEEQIEVSVDSQDCIRIPAEIQNRLGLSPGITLVVEEREKGEICLRVQKEIPELVDKYGVLVVKSEATGDLAEAVEHEHGRHARKQRSKSSLDELQGIV